MSVVGCLGPADGLRRLDDAETVLLDEAVDDAEVPRHLLRGLNSGRPDRTPRDLASSMPAWTLS